MSGRARWLTSVVIAVGILGGGALPAGAEVSAGSSDTPSAKKLARGAVKELGAEAIIAAVLALDLGYTAPQIVDAMEQHTLVASGAITDASGVKVQPAGTPSGVIAGDDLRAPVSLDALRDQAPDERRLAIAELIQILVAAGRGYSPDEIIVDGLMNDGFGSGFGPPGVISGVPRPSTPPDPDLLGDLLKGVKASPGVDKSGAFVGIIELGSGWDAGTATASPTVRKSKVRLRIEVVGGPNPIPGGEEHLFGSYSFTVDAPGIVGPCSLGLKYTGTIDLLSDDIGFSGTAYGDGTSLSNDGADCPGDQPFSADWTISVIRPSDTRLAGQMTFRALTVTFEAAVPAN